VFALLYRIANFPMHIEMADYWSLLTKPGRKTSCQMLVSLIISIWRENNAGIFSADISVISYIFSKNQTVHPEFMQRKALFFKEKKMSKQKNLNILFCKAKLRLILYLPSFDMFGRFCTDALSVCCERR